MIACDLLVRLQEMAALEPGHKQGSAIVKDLVLVLPPVGESNLISR